MARPVLRLVYVCGELRLGDTPLRKGATSIGRAGDVVVDDPHASRRHAELSADDDAVVLKNLSSFGTFVNGARVDDRRALKDGDCLRIGDSFFVLRWTPDGLADVPSAELLGRAPAMSAVRHLIKAVAPTQATVLIVGETGTGKELVSRAVHHESRRAGPLLALNCAAIPPELAESQLFGHKTGAFTGAARDQAGYFRDAASGTLFLDELGELPLPVQAKLLRALDERMVTPVGSTTPVPTDVRLVCATHRNLEEEVRANRFRGDLYARIAEMKIPLPPLRDRREDILLLLSSFIGPGASFSPHLASALLCHQWPFNVRELAKVASELRVKGEGAHEFNYRMVADRLPDPDLAPDSEPVAGSPVQSDPGPPTREQLIELLTRHHGRVLRIAEECKRSRMQVYRWLEAYGLNADDYRS